MQKATTAREKQLQTATLRRIVQAIALRCVALRCVVAKNRQSNNYAIVKWGSSRQYYVGTQKLERQEAFQKSSLSRRVQADKNMERSKKSLEQSNAKNALLLKWPHDFLAQFRAKINPRNLLKCWNYQSHNKHCRNKVRSRGNLPAPYMLFFRCRYAISILALRYWLSICLNHWVKVITMLISLEMKSSPREKGTLETTGSYLTFKLTYSHTLVLQPSGMPLRRLLNLSEFSWLRLFVI